MLKLSERLQTIAELVPPRARVADIGSDHALLPVYLVQCGKTPFAVAGELNDGPLQAAARQVEAAGLADRVAVRKGDGLAVVAAGEVDCVAIAGMGGALIADILSAGQSTGKLDGADALVLQPNVGEDIVRRWLRAHGWHLALERLVEEDGKFYEVLLALRAADAAPLDDAVYDPAWLPLDWSRERKAEWLVRMGPWLMRRPDETFARKWRAERRKLDAIRARIDRSDTPEARRKSAELRQRSEEIGEVLACLHMDKPSRSS